MSSESGNDLVDPLFGRGVCFDIELVEGRGIDAAQRQFRREPHGDGGLEYLRIQADLTSEEWVRRYVEMAREPRTQRDPPWPGL